jgi:hypothetical protein
MSGLEEHDEAPIEVEEDTLTSALADAWDASESTDDTEHEGDTVLEPNIESSDASAGEPTDNATDLETVQPVDGVTADTSTDNPPVGLSLEAREAWKDVPDSVKADIVKRENDYAAGIEKHRQNSSRAEAMDRSLAPYQQYFQMNGGAGQSLQSLLQTGSTLQMGSPIQKAQVAANIIQQYGIDIKTLDSMLVGEAPSQETQQQNQMEQMLNQRLAPLQQQLGQYQQREQHQAQQAQGKVAQEVTNFGAQNEFYNDVRGDMADLLDMAANRGREMSMDEAYSLSCANHPQISKIMSGRTSQQSVDKKRQAASSISGSPGGGMQGQAPNSLSAALNDAWDSVGRM